MILYTPTSKNFKYLKTVFFGTHDNAVSQMQPWVTHAQLVAYCSAVKAPSVYKMRLLERHLDLPFGWLERDIQALSKMSEDDFKLVQVLLAQPNNIKIAIKALLDS